jgi:hypothetical protein
MHCIQYIATQADSVDEAFSSVKSYLEEHLGGEYDNSNAWYDWFVTGGGRWSTSGNSYDNDYTNDVVHQNDPKFQEYLDTAHKYRLESLNEYIEQARKVNLSDIIDKLGDFEHDHHSVGFELYPIKKLYDLSIGMWDYNSYFFDIRHDTANRIHMLRSIDNGAKDWYLVPVDFHF